MDTYEITSATQRCAFVSAPHVTSCKYGMPSAWFLGYITKGLPHKPIVVKTRAIPWKSVAAGSVPLHFEIARDARGWVAREPVPYWVAMLCQEMKWPRIVGQTELSADVPQKHFHLFGPQVQEVLDSLAETQKAARKWERSLDALGVGRRPYIQIAEVLGMITEDEARFLLAMGARPRWIEEGVKHAEAECQKLIPEED